ncbi:MAG: acyl-ACP--UDP-N-acetylglucosamine O-acyltransferase [Nitrospirae bacterium]|nr:acyl-ACP--UDP-N-acetylglucosamine O-acyltransferase [Nitrospirota bacterium]MBF0591061.1 acyl-ACP--UDP-N-acetylglucosamine O-acyltransferase [Nitrospirota bacterium]
MQAKIHPTAIIGDDVEIDEDTEIGPYCIIGNGSKIARGTRLISNVILEGTLEIGLNCTVHPFTSIGFPPQDLKYDGRQTSVKIGNNNIIREYATIHRASIHGDGTTVIGDGNFIMAYVHVAHDCKLGNNIVMANAATLAGHVEIEDHAVIGGVVAIHQFTRIGTFAMVGGFSGVGQDVPPFTIASGPRARLFGLNLIGLKRNGFSDETIQRLKEAYKILFRDKLTLTEALRKLQEDIEMTPEIKMLIDFISKNKRGICRQT